jgi:hypothetical protein
VPVDFLDFVLEELDFAGYLINHIFSKFLTQELAGLAQD